MREGDRCRRIDTRRDRDSGTDTYTYKRINIHVHLEFVALPLYWLQPCSNCTHGEAIEICELDVLLVVRVLRGAGLCQQVLVELGRVANCVFVYVGW